MTKYLSPSVIIIPFPYKEYMTMEEEIEAKIKELLDEFDCQESNPRTHAAFYNRLDLFNKAICEQWGICHHTIYGYINNHKLVVHSMV
jgi:hypothetical protein